MMMFATWFVSPSPQTASPSGERAGVRGRRSGLGDATDFALPPHPTLSPELRSEERAYASFGREGLLVRQRHALFRLRLARALDAAEQRVLLAGVDLDVRAHAGAQDRTLLRVNLQAHRNALHDLDPVAGRVLRRQHGEVRARRRTDRGHVRRPFLARVGVDLNR